MKKAVRIICLLLIVSGHLLAQEEREEVKMKYVYSYEEALKKAKQENKLIFFNCFADWAHPCHGMNQKVFSNQEFADWMDKHFVNFFMDVTTREGRPLAERYAIRFQAHYLVLDSKGDIVLRIVGGTDLPEFKEQVALALSEKTSLKGMSERYHQGKRDVRTLRNYAVVLKLADETEKYQQVVDEYFAKIKKTDWSNKENWMFYRDKLKEPQGEMFDYLMEYKAEFVKRNGEKAVNDCIVFLYFRPVYAMATGGEYDGNKLLDIYLSLQKADIPDDQAVFYVYEIAKYRGERNWDKMIGALEKASSVLDERAVERLNTSLKDLEDLSPQDINKVVAYLSRCAEKAEGNVQDKYRKILKGMVHPEGIRFESFTFHEALEKAKQEKKLIFVDCYTSWCGPCKMMSNQVFTQKFVGDFFNKHFVNLKIDMERGEGVELQKKYEVNAFPTMMLLDGEGKVVYKILGGCNAREFMEKIQRGIQPEYCYYFLKEKYQAGERSAAVMSAYLVAMQDAGELKDGATVIRNYLDHLENAEKFSKPVWKLYDLWITDYRMPEFQFVCVNRKYFAEINGEEAVNRKIEEMIFPAVIGYLKGEKEKEEIVRLKKLITEANLPADFSLNCLQQIVSLYEDKSVDKLLELYETKVAALQDPQTRLNLDILLNTLMTGATVEQRDRAIAYVKKCKDEADPRALSGYESLLQALTEKKE